MNEVRLMGYTGKDIELKYMPNGNAVINFSISTEDRYKDKAGVTQKKTEWHNLVQFGKGAEITQKYVTKGSQILVEGKLQTRQWEDRDGNKRQKTEIVVQRVEFGRLKENHAGQQGEPYPQAPQRSAAQRQGPGSDDDMPFDDQGATDAF
jgi:single-strand DNA-binding protein